MCLLEETLLYPYVYVFPPDFIFFRIVYTKVHEVIKQHGRFNN